LSATVLAEKRSGNRENAVQDAPRISERLRRNASFWERQPSGALEIWNVVLHRQHRHDRKFSIRKFILKR